MNSDFDEIDTKLKFSLRKTMLSEPEIDRIFAGDLLVHDINIHPDTIGDLLDQICADFGVDYGSFNWREYYFPAGGVVDTIFNWNYFLPSRQFIAKRYKPIDIDFLRRVARSKKLPPVND